MNSTLKALRTLAGEPELIRHAPLSRKLDPLKECRGLVHLREKFRADAQQVKVTPSRLDSKVIWHRFQNGGYDLDSLNSLEVRTLCTSDEAAVHPRFVEALSKRPEALRRSLCLYGLVNAYFSRWRSMDSPEELERVLKNAIARYPRVTPAISRWRSAPSLFSSEAAERLAEFIAERKSEVANVLRLQYVGLATRLAVHTRERAAEISAKRLRGSELTADPATNLRYLQWMIKEVLADGSPVGAIRKAASLLILSDSADRSHEFQQILQAFVEDSSALGDPRFRENGPNWRDMDPESARRFLSWIAKKYIQFFFNTILPRNDENRRRAEFWLRYHKQISGFPGRHLGRGPLEAEEEQSCQSSSIACACHPGFYICVLDAVCRSRQRLRDC